MPHIVFIHGMSNRDSPAKLLSQWQTALGAESGIQLDQFGCTSEMVYWADVLYSDLLAQETVGADAEAAAQTVADEKSWEQIGKATEKSPEQAMFIAGLTGKYAAIAMQVAANEKTSSSSVARADELSWVLKPSLMATFLRDIHHYLFNSPWPGKTKHVQEEIRHRFVKALRDRADAAGPCIVVSHGVGSVIAYDCLMRVADCPAIDGLMTIGSPLGFDEIQGKLKPGWSRENGFPARTVRGMWINVFDPRDPVAGFDPRLANDFQKDECLIVQDIIEPNSGLWHHDIGGYLGGSKLRSALRDMLQLSVTIPRTSSRDTSEHDEQPAAKPAGMRTAVDSAPAKSQLETEFGRFSSSQIFHEFAVAIYNSHHRRVAQIAEYTVRELCHGRKLLTKPRAQELLALLRRKRYFRQMVQVGDALIQTGLDDPQIRRQYAQGLIDSAQGLTDTGNMTAALSILQGIVDQNQDQRELSEARGLIGRIHKQLYLNAANDGAPKSKEKLRSALNAYYEVYQTAPEKFAWHGINTVALLARAKRDGLLQPDFPDYDHLARQILAGITPEKNDDPWSLATAAEAHIALGDFEQATELIQKYARDNEVDAFELNSFLRQLKEVWQFSAEDERHAAILALVQSELMLRQGSQMQVDATDLKMDTLLKLKSEGKLEKVFGEDSYKTLLWYKKGLERCSCVARFETKMGRGMGSGFIVDGGQVHNSLRNRFLVLTNAHVLSADPADQPALRLENAVVWFECWLDGCTRYEVDQVVWSSPRSKLDATLVALKPELSGCVGHGKWQPVNAQQKSVYLIGHPLGGGLSLSLHDNKFLAFRDPKLHYRTPSEPGSSGSPVFDDNWDFIGLHHAGSFEMPRLDGSPGTIEANEGISLEAIRLEIAAKLGGGEPNR